MGKAMFTIIGAMAELERNLIRERVVAGMEHARHHGTKTENAIGRPKRIFDRTEVVRLRDGGLSIEKIAHEMRLGVGTVVRVIQEHQAEPATFQNHSAVNSPSGARSKGIPGSPQHLPQAQGFGKTRFCPINQSAAQAGRGMATPKKLVPASFGLSV
jgi:hypothetical protein